MWFCSTNPYVAVDSCCEDRTVRPHCAPFDMPHRPSLLTLGTTACGLVLLVITASLPRPPASSAPIVDAARVVALPRVPCPRNTEFATNAVPGPFRLPPVVAKKIASQPVLTSPIVESRAAVLPPTATVAVTKQSQPERGRQAQPYDLDAALAAAADWDDIVRYYPSEEAQSGQVAAMVREAFGLTRSGALFAGEQKFRDALSFVAQTRDAAYASADHAMSLTAAFNALDEANDFLKVASASQVSGSSVAAIAGAHTTPVLTEIDIEKLLPHEAIALYHRYGERKLALAVGGDSAASMALYGLGRIYAQRAELDANDASAARRSVSMYQAAVMTRSDNPLAANELGVSLARGGRYALAQPYLLHAVQLAPTANHHHNLAVVERQLGNQHVANQLDATATQLAAREMAGGQLSQRRGIAWVSPEDFNRSSEAGPQLAPQPKPATLVPAYVAANTTQPTAPQSASTSKSAITRFFGNFRSDETSLEQQPSRPPNTLVRPPGSTSPAVASNPAPVGR